MAALGTRHFCRVVSPPFSLPNRLHRSPAMPSVPELINLMTLDQLNLVWDMVDVARARLIVERARVGPAVEDGLRARQVAMARSVAARSRQNTAMPGAVASSSSTIAAPPPPAMAAPPTSAIPR